MMLLMPRKTLSFHLDFDGTRIAESQRAERCHSFGGDHTALASFPSRSRRGFFLFW